MSIQCTNQGKGTEFNLFTLFVIYVEQLNYTNHCRVVKNRVIMLRCFFAEKRCKLWYGKNWND